eukprot:9228487-Ditylum_brightwellii.AAC.1
MSAARHLRIPVPAPIEECEPDLRKFVKKVVWCQISEDVGCVTERPSAFACFDGGKMSLDLIQGVLLESAYFVCLLPLL